MENLEKNLLTKMSHNSPQNLMINDNIIVTEVRPQIKDLDSIPYPDRTLVDYDRYKDYIGMSYMKNAIAIQATRGCPYNCSYCHKIWPKSHVVRSAENIFEEVLYYYNLGIRNIVFIDDIFNLNVQNSSKFFNLIINNNLKIKISFPNGLRGDILTKEYIDLMVKAGTVQVTLALETASPRLQRLIGKNLNIEKIRENIHYFTEKHPYVMLDMFFMIGFPTETEDEALMTLNFVQNIKWLHFPYFNILKIYPNTDMEKLALENGISREMIDKSTDLAYHELPETLPFSKRFVKMLQLIFLSEYFLSKERLKKVIEIQRRILSDDEIIKKYSTYLSTKKTSIADIMEISGINNYVPLNNIEQKSTEEISMIKPVSGAKSKVDNIFAIKILLLDLSQHFSKDTDILFEIAEPPLGLMYLLTYLNRQLGNKVDGKIAKSRFDFDSYDELKQIIMQFNPDVIGIRTLSCYKDFFHKIISLIRQWRINTPVITGGPYATSDYRTILKDSNVDLVILGEGEITLYELIVEFLKNNKKMPGYDVLMKIKGIAFRET